MEQFFRIFIQISIFIQLNVISEFFYIMKDTTNPYNGSEKRNCPSN